VTKLRTHFKHNVVAYLALFVALGGTSYAAIALPVGSVGTRQLRNEAVTNGKLARGSVGAANLSHNSIAGYVRDWVKIANGGIITASRPRARLVQWSDQPGTPYPGGFVSWGHPIPQFCFAEATTGFTDTFASYASAAILSAGNRNAKGAGAYIHLSAPNTPVNVAIICPQP